MFDFNQSYFALFDLPEQFELNTSELASAFRDLQATYHPDRFVNASDQERRVAVQTTGFINTANETLKSHRLRARYLLALKGIDFDDEIDTTSDGMFLMQQMEMREALENVQNAGESTDDALEAVEKIAKDVGSQLHQLQDGFVNHYLAENFIEAKEIVLKMKFFERLNNEVKTLTEKLEDEIF